MNGAIAEETIPTFLANPKNNARFITTTMQHLNNDRPIIIGI